MTTRPFLSVDDIYRRLILTPNGSRFRKVELHVHSPASENDYKYENQLVEMISLSQLESDVCSSGLIYTYPEGLDDEVEKKRHLVYLLMADAAFDKGTEILVLTDHDTAVGYNALMDALTHVKAARSHNRRIDVLLGVEINTVDQVHIIGIVDSNKHDLLIKLLDVLKYYGETERKPTIEMVVSELNAIGAIIYFPHYNTIKNPTSRIKQQIFGNPLVHAVGVNKLEALAGTRSTALSMKGDRKEPIPIVIDSDAHHPHEIGKNELWMKLEKANTAGIKYALRQPDRIVFKAPEQQRTPRFIGIAAHDCPLGKDGGLHTLCFSDRMNCITGSRGTGKSTILKLLRLCGTGQLSYTSISELKATLDWYRKCFIQVNVYFDDGKNLYAFEINPQKRNPAENDLRKAYLLDRSEELLSDVRYWITVYKMAPNGCFVPVQSSEGKQNVMRRTLTTSVGQSEIERLAGSPERFYSFLEERILKSLQRKEYEKAINTYSKHTSALKNVIQSAHSYQDAVTRRDMFSSDFSIAYRSWLESRKKLQEVLSPIQVRINTALNGRSLISIIPSSGSGEHVADWIFEKLPKIHKRYAKYSEIISLALSSILYPDMLEGIQRLSQFSDIELVEKYSIQSFEPTTKAEIDEGLEKLSSESVARLSREYFFEIHLQYHTGNISVAIKDDYSLYMMHNRNLWHNPNAAPEYLSIDTLSLGQKCVAIMDLIITMTAELGENGPLLLDQPEDHLDNRYIHDHLAASLRNTKLKRQLIVSTHNPNIPVCTDAESILIMDGDGEHFWATHCGGLDYQDGRSGMVKEVQAILEGGSIAFEHRMDTYGYTYKPPKQ